MYFRAISKYLSEKLSMQHKSGLTEMNNQAKKGESHSLVAQRLQLRSVLLSLGRNDFKVSFRIE
jgi:hypothetical protein